MTKILRRLFTGILAVLGFTGCNNSYGPPALYGGPPPRDTMKIAKEVPDSTTQASPNPNITETE